METRIAVSFVTPSCLKQQKKGCLGHLSFVGYFSYLALRLGGLETLDTLLVLTDADQAMLLLKGPQQSGYTHLA